MLLYLSDSGGHTCFPNLGCSPLEQKSKGLGKLWKTKGAPASVPSNTPQCDSQCWLADGRVKNAKRNIAHLQGIQPREGRVLVFCSTKPTQRYGQQSKMEHVTHVLPFFVFLLSMLSHFIFPT